jgi:hypothetical protein
MIFDKLWRLERLLARVKRAHNREIKRLKRMKTTGELKTTEELEIATQDAMWENDTLLDEIESIKGFRLIDRANRLGLPTPRFRPTDDEADEGGTWERGYTGTYYPSRAAQADLRSRIRQEEKERREVIAFWIKDILVPVLSSAVGILGATIGVIAFHKK